ncbi:MAG TPA: sulfotransferase [Steroidobacteraceae bacterium]|nr:sulfotransferase [Steroidobacteraceae bacterium]
MTHPSLPEFQREISNRMARHDWPAAAAAAAACRAAWPADSTGWLLGSFVALLTDQKEAALAMIERHLAAEPADFPCLLQRAECLLALGRRADALAAADSAATAAGGNGAALGAVGALLTHAAEQRLALAMYDRAVAAAPADRMLLARRAEVHRSLGNFDLAARDYDALLAIAPTDPEALGARAALRRQSRADNSIGAMEAALAALPAGSSTAAALHFGLAKSYEDVGEYAAGWRHLIAGNALVRARLRYDARQDQAVIERIIASFPRVEALTPDATGEAPIFILGLPRTGTTLVERVLGSHSQVHAAGELTALSEAITAVIGRGAPLAPRDWLEFAATLGDLDGAAIAREYLARTRARRGERPRFIDKQTVNFFYCALIFRAFPNARIVHLTRHPLAACYAIFKTDFGGTYPFCYELGELGEFYLGYRRLMAHWHRVLPGRILDLAYEDLVTSHEATIRRLLEYLGLPFEAACLDFHQNPAPTTTASSVQVRQPLYDSSLEQWRHYADGLAPLRARLEAGGIAVD